MRQPGDGNIALLAMDELGYANLMKLVSRAHLDAADVETAHTTAAVLAAHAAGLIALTGGPDGPIDRALRDSQGALAEARLDRLKAMFGDRLYVELQRHGLKSEHDVEPQLLEARLRQAHPHRRHQREPISPRPTTTRRTMRCCASPAAATWSRTTAAASRASTTSRAPRRWRRCSPTCRKRSTTPSRSPSAAPSGPRAASRSCRASSPSPTR